MHPFKAACKFTNIVGSKRDGFKPTTYLFPFPENCKAHTLQMRVCTSWSIIKHLKTFKFKTFLFFSSFLDLSPSHKGELKLHLQSWCFLGLKWLQFFLLSLQKKIWYYIYMFTLVVSLLICLFFGWMRMVKVEEIEQKRKRKRKKSVYLLFFWWLDCLIWKKRLCVKVENNDVMEGKKKNLFCWLIQTKRNFLLSIHLIIKKWKEKQILFFFFKKHLKTHSQTLFSTFLSVLERKNKTKNQWQFCFLTVEKKTQKKSAFFFNSQYFWCFFQPSKLFFQQLKFLMFFFDCWSYFFDN